MSKSAYFVSWEMTQNRDLMMRVAASAQQEASAAQIPDFDPETWAHDNRWKWATLSDWVAAVSAAMETGITAWGTAPAVITDGMILSYVQPAVSQ